MSTTPPSSNRLPVGSILSETTPLKKESNNPGLYSSTPRYSKAGSRYKKMAIDACENFVGPLTVETFLSEFVPSNTKEPRPIVEIPFDYETVSQYETEFASIAMLIDDFRHLMLYTD